MQQRDQARRRQAVVVGADGCSLFLERNVRATMTASTPRCFSTFARNWSVCVVVQPVIIKNCATRSGSRCVRLDFRYHIAQLQLLHHNDTTTVHSQLALFRATTFFKNKTSCIFITRVVIIQRSFRYTYRRYIVVTICYYYNKIKLLQFCVHVNAELLSLSQKVIYFLTVYCAFDVFNCHVFRPSFVFLPSFR